jgi:maltose 6'-phosphate phosphatase
MGQVNAPYIGLINIYSAHLSWWDDGFAEQFENLNNWAVTNQTKNLKGSLLCGDFNVASGSEGYNLVVRTHDYEDQFLVANNHGAAQKIFKVNDAYWQHQYLDDYRIDYIFLSKTSQLEAVSAQVLFTSEDYGRVSDHCGYLVTFEPK